MQVSQLQDSAITLENGFQFSMRRCDLIHPLVGGNKWFKLKYNIAAMRKQGLNTLLTFGGRHSNHLSATAAAGAEFRFKTVGIVRGDESSGDTPTLMFSKSQGMDLLFPGREGYDSIKTDNDAVKMLVGRQDVYLLPEGGAGLNAVYGCAEILSEEDHFDLVCCGVGTGATLAGLIVGSNDNTKVLGFSALSKTAEQEALVQGLLKEYDQLNQTNHTDKEWEILPENQFGGFAKMDRTLYDFAEAFYRSHDIQLDYIYNAKMMKKLSTMYEVGELEGKSVLIINTGGLQGNQAMLDRWQHQWKLEA